jgi:hypothetical protein
MIEAGPALRADVSTCGCGAILWGAPLAYSIFLTRQATFPAYFVAQVRTDEGGNSSQDRAIVVLVFQRLSASTSWKVVIDSQQQDLVNKPAAQTIDHPVTDPEGFDRSSVFNFPGGVGALSGHLAAYWEYWARHWKAPVHSGFLPNYWTNAWSQNMVAEERTGDPITGNAVRFHFYDSGAADTWVAPDQGFAIAFGSIVLTATYTAPGGFVYQDASQDQFPPALAPGRYSSVVETSLIEPWFNIFPNGTSYVYGSTAWPVSVVGHGRRPLP